MENIVEAPEFCRMRKVPARDFWGHFMSQTAFGIPDDIKQLLGKILVIPMGSADAERAFSVMNHIKHKRRGRMGQVNLEELLRIRLNGPNRLELFPAAKYSKLWIEAGHMRSDDPFFNRKPTITFSENDDLEDKSEKAYLDGSTLF